MCSIFVSNSKSRFQKLVDLNQSRGKFSYSYGGFDEKNNFFLEKKNFGVFDKEVIRDDFKLHIGHCQAPTGGLVKDFKKIHPSKLDNQYLYHNGILKPSFLEKSTINYNGWDTFYLNYLLLDGFKSLDLIEGSFACVLVRFEKVYFFRNSLCPLYLYHGKDGELSISSIKFDQSFLIDSGIIYKIFGENYELEYVTNFKDLNLVYRN